MSGPVYSELRLRSRVSDAAIRDQVAGKVLSPEDYDVVLTGATRLRKPNGQPLCVYLPRAVAQHSQNPDTYQTLHDLRSHTSNNRGHASGTQRVRSNTNAGRSYAVEVASSIIGSIDPMGQQRYCRLTAWTGQNLPQWQTLQPLLQSIAGAFATHVPDRYAAQEAVARRSDPAWTVPGTPFSTVTVNNTYPTGVHQDKGDLDAGFSSIAVLRRGPFTGGCLVFPAWRVAVDLQDGDLILMDAHDWHGNTLIVCGCGRQAKGPCGDCGAERISVVSYFRTRIAECGTPEAELKKADRLRAKT